jgi:hypothetical protein
LDTRGIEVLVEATSEIAEIFSAPLLIKVMLRSTVAPGNKPNAPTASDPPD